MLLGSLVSTLVGLSLVAAVPTSFDERATSPEKRDVIIQQTVFEPQLVSVNQNLGALSPAALLAEQQLAAQVQSQLALINTVNTIKNNIRINTFKSRWTQVNTVIVTVTNVVDARDPNNINTRYMVNQVKADNNNPAQEVIVMLTAADALTIGPQATAAAVNVPGVLGAPNAVSQPTSLPQVAQLDPNLAFAQAANGGVLLPFNSTAPQPPTGAQLFPDPAAIILPNQNLFVGDVAQIQQDAALLAAGSLFNLQQQLLAQQAIAQAELAGIVLGTAPPPTIIISTNGAPLPAPNNGQQNNTQPIAGRQNARRQNGLQKKNS